MILPDLPASVTARTMPGPASESKPTMPVRFGMALDDGGGVRRNLLDVGARLLVGHHLDARAFLGQRIAQALAGRR